MSEVDEGVLADCRSAQERGYAGKYDEGYAMGDDIGQCVLASHVHNILVFLMFS